MAFNAETFDEKTKDFVLYVIDNYGKLYAAKQQMSPIKAELSEDVDYSDLYLRIQEDMQSTGENFLKPGIRIWIPTLTQLCRTICCSWRPETLLWMNSASW